MRVALRSLRASGAFHSSALQRADKSPLASALPVECAVLHRVVAPPRDRHSIPFLVDLKTA